MNESLFSMKQLAIVWVLLIAFTVAPQLNQTRELEALGANDSTAVLIEVTLDPYEPEFALPDTTR